MNRQDAKIAKENNINAEVQRGRGAGLFRRSARIGGAEWGFIVGLLLLAVGLRFVGNTHGQPAPVYSRSDAPFQRLPLETPIHTDEYFFVAIPFHMAVTKYPNPKFFENPSLFLNLNFVTYWATGAADGIDPAWWEGRSQRQYAPFPLYVIGRVYSALGGLIAVAGAYAVARRLGGRFAAAGAGLLTALSFTMVQHGHYATPSGTAAGLTMVCVWASLASLQQRDGPKGWLFALAGIGAGLATSARYNALAVAIVVFLCGLVLWARYPSWRTARIVLVGWALIPLAFVFGTPGAVFDFEYWWSDFRHIFSQFLITGEGFDANYLTNPWWSLGYHLRYLALFSLGIPAVVAVILGMWRGLKGGAHGVSAPGVQNPRLSGADSKPLKGLESSITSSRLSIIWQTRRVFVVILIVCLVAYTLVVLRNIRPSYNDHMLVPIIPALAVFAGLGVGWVYERIQAWMRSKDETDAGEASLAPTSGRLHWAEVLVGPVLLVGLVIVTLVPAVQIDALWTQPETRYLMQQWVYDHVPRGSRIHLSGPYNVPLDPADYDVTQTYINDFTDVEDLRGQGVDYTILSDAWGWDVQRSYEWMSPEFRAQVAAWYESFEDDASRIAWIPRPRWTGFDWLMHTASYWHDPGLTLYCLNEAACEAVK